jgi:hypothetical protein
MTKEDKILVEKMLKIADNIMEKDKALLKMLSNY